MRPMVITTIHIKNSNNSLFIIIFFILFFYQSAIDSVQASTIQHFVISTKQNKKQNKPDNISAKKETPMTVT